MADFLIYCWYSLIEFRINHSLKLLMTIKTTKPNISKRRKWEKRKEWNNTSQLVYAPLDEAKDAEKTKPALDQHSCALVFSLIKRKRWITERKMWWIFKKIKAASDFYWKWYLCFKTLCFLPQKPILIMLKYFTTSFYARFLSFCKSANIFFLYMFIHFSIYTKI